MITVEICEDEFGFDFLTGEYLQHAGPRFDLPDETVARWKTAFEEFDAVQREMSALFDSRKCHVCGEIDCFRGHLIYDGKLASEFERSRLDDDDCM